MNAGCCVLLISIMILIRFPKTFRTISQFIKNQQNKLLKLKLNSIC